MGTLIFVHGTGVREEGSKASNEAIQKGFARHPSYKTVFCNWGDTFGVKFDRRFKSIPAISRTRGVGAPAPDFEAGEAWIWGVLYDDPLFELRDLTVQGPASRVSGTFRPPSNAAQDLRAKTVPFSEGLHDRFQGAGLEGELEDARREVTASAEYAGAVAAREGDVFPWAEIARAVVAQAMSRSERRGNLAETFKDSRLRDELVDSLRTELGDTGLTTRGPALSLLGRVAATLVSPALRWKRTEVMRVITPGIGDVLLYQSHGGPIRDQIRRAVNQGEPPVVLLGHSLGGIACVDLLLAEDRPVVDLLVTVGSQASFFYEIGSLFSLSQGQPLPEPGQFPNWLNIYDRADLLSFVGSELFPGLVEDVPVNNGQPFPYSHISYWKNDEVWDAISKRLPPERRGSPAPTA